MKKIRYKRHEQKANEHQANVNGITMIKIKLGYKQVVIQVKKAYDQYIDNEIAYGSEIL